MAEGQGADDEAGHDLVADAEIDGGIEHVVAQRDGGRHGDDVARKERKVHARLALGDAIAHGGHAAGDLGRGTDLAGGFFDDVGIELVGLMGAQHVVVAGDDAEVERLVAGESRLLGGAAGGKAVGEITAGERGAINALLPGGFEAVEIVAARVAAARGNAVGHVLDGLTDGHGWSLHVGQGRAKGGPLARAFLASIWRLSAARAVDWGPPQEPQGHQ